MNIPHFIEPLESRIAPAAAVFSLASLDGTNGFKLSGVAAADHAGRSVSDAGDINGDGFDDVIVGAYGSDPKGVDSGASYVVFGKFEGFTANLDFATLDGRNGFKIIGVAANDRSGRAVSAAGDINGDGVGDLIIGAPGADPTGSNSGASYVVLGTKNGFEPVVNLGTLNGTNGFKISGVAAGDESGSSVSAAGDINGDGIGDLMIGAPGADPNGAGSGASYVVFGTKNGFAPNLNLVTLNGRNGFKLSGSAAGDESGRSVSGAGDVNGDGIDDLIIGAPGADANGANSGASYVVLGTANGFTANLNLSTINGGNGFKLSGTRLNDRSGYSVSGAGDVNGDGFDDVIVAAHPSRYSGSSYVVFGKGVEFAPNLSLSTLDGANGFQVGDGKDPGSFSVSGAGDLNGDGFDDLLVGAAYAPSKVASGVSYVVFGKGSGFASKLPVANLNGSNGFTINGVTAGDRAGISVSAAGDVNGDGFADLIVGADGADPHGVDSGASYVFFGGELGPDLSI